MITSKIILFAAVVLGVEINLAKGRILTEPQVARKTCETPICLDEASKLKSQMDWNVEPCVNFYEFVCGQAYNTTAIPKYQDKVDILQVLAQNIPESIREVLEVPISPNDTRATQMTKTYYRNCLDMQTVERQGLEPLREVLKKLGGWPVVDSDWNETSFTWTDYNHKITELGYFIHPFLDIYLSLDRKNSSKFIIRFEAPIFELSKESDNETVQTHKKFMLETAVLLNSSINVDRVSAEIDEALNLMIRLENITTFADNRMSQLLLDNQMTVAELTKRFPYVSWLEYLNKVLEPHAVIDENEVVTVADLKYFSHLGDVLKQTPKRTQANYAIWSVIFASVDYLGGEIRDKLFDFLKATKGINAFKERWKECIGLTKVPMATGVSSAFGHHYVDEGSRNYVKDMAASIRRELTKSISEASWLDEEARIRALKKLERINITVGMPDEVLDGVTVDDFYSTLEINPGSFLESKNNATRFNLAFTFKKYRRPVGDYIWLQFTGLSVHATYYPQLNSILIPACLMRRPVYSKERPRYMNYGTLGYIIGHELVHGFDSDGVKLDENRNFTNWWKNESKAVFADKTECLVQHYGNFTDELTRIKVNGQRTVTENMADVDGVKHAYRAYLQLQKKQGEDPALPGFENYTSRQMFWISMARMWCTKYSTEQSRRYYMNFGLNVIDKHRVNGNLQTQEDFAKDFNCPVGSPMNPAKKCVIW